MLSSSHFTATLPLRVIFGNDLNALSDPLVEELFASSSRPFEKRLIIVPDLSVKTFIFDRLVNHPRLKIAAGVQVLPLNQALIELTSIRQRSQRVPSLLELTLAIEEKLHICLEEDNFRSLSKYLEGSGMEKRNRWIAALSDQLARLFTRYGLYGISFLPAWLNQEVQGWQQFLWRALFSKDSPWTYPLEMFKTVHNELFKGKICLFGFSHLAPVYLFFFSTLGATLYQLSPSAQYWDDNVSDRERVFNRRALKRREVKESIQEELDQYLDLGHPLLRNWGKLGRQMLQSLDGFNLIEKELYQEPQKTNLLAQLKRSLMTLEESSCLIADNSIQLHSATSRLREVEALKDTLETLLQTQLQKEDQIKFQDILVISPDISMYAPYIEMVFSSSSMPYLIEGLPFSSHCQMVQGFLQLLSLKEERFSLSCFLKLLECSSLVDKWRFTIDEINQLSKWLKDAEIRKELDSHPNSWSVGIDRLLYGLAIIPNRTSSFESWPLASIAQSDIDLFNRFLELLEEIKKDSSQLVGQKGAREWFEIFLALLDKYFSLEGPGETFYQELKKISLSCRHFDEKIWNFESIQRIVLSLSQRSMEGISSSLLQKITFSNYQYHRIKTPRILWCLGMDEGAFPQADRRSSLCEMSRLRAADYYPVQVDEDRAFFLDLLLKTSDYLIFSFQRIHPQDGKSQGPSLLIEELEQYIFQHSQNRGIKKVEHPAFVFDHRYFSDEAPVKKWAKLDYLAAKAHYFPHFEKQSFFDVQSIDAQDDLQQPLLIDIRQLKKLARHPLQFYFNETLKIYLQEEKDEEEVEFLISHLRRSMLRKKTTKVLFSQVVNQLRSQGKLPCGLFQELACEELQEDIQDLQETLNAFGVCPSEIRAIHFSSSCLEHEKNEVFLPPLSIPLTGSKTVQIIGKLEDVTSQGLLFHGDSDLKSLVKAWPLFLIYCCLKPENPKLLLTKGRKALQFNALDPMAALSSYLEYFLKSKKSPSPLMPEWSEALLQKEELDLFKAISKKEHYEDVYLNYLERRQGLFETKEIFEMWSRPLRETFAPLIEGGRNVF